MATKTPRPTQEPADKLLAAIDEAISHTYAGRYQNPDWEQYANILLDKRLRVKST